METPCIKLCVIDQRAAICSGCGRSVTEIASWTSLSTGERRRIIAELPRRLAVNGLNPVGSQ